MLKVEQKNELIIQVQKNLTELYYLIFLIALFSTEKIIPPEWQRPKQRKEGC